MTRDTIRVTIPTSKALALARHVVLTSSATRSKTSVSQARDSYDNARGSTDKYDRLVPPYAMKGLDETNDKRYDSSGDVRAGGGGGGMGGGGGERG